MRLRIIVLAFLMPLLSGCASTTSTDVTPLPSALTDAKPVVTVFIVSPVSIVAGQKARLQWEVSGTAAVRIEPGLGNVGASGSIDVSPLVTTTYTLTAGETTATVTLTVGPGAPIVEYFIAIPPEIYFGQSGTLEWNVIGAASVSIDNGIGTTTASGSVVVFPTTTTLYTLTASNARGSVTASALVINQGRLFGVP